MKPHFFQQSHQGRRDGTALDSSFRQDGFVRAAALSVVDRLVSRSAHDTPVLCLLLGKLSRYFPESVPDVSYATPVEILGLMTNTPQKASRTALELTWVLRQLIIDTMCQSPVQYLPAFYQQGDVIKPTEMRHLGIGIDKVGLNALAKLLDMAIVVHQTDKNKQLPAKLKYGQGETELHIDENDGRFSPRVKNKNIFRPISSLSKVHPKLSGEELQDDSVVKQVQSLMQHIYLTNDENVSWLNNMLEDGSLTYDDLLKLYIANADVMTWQREFIEPATGLKGLLVNIAAAMLSFGMISREELFGAKIEKIPSSLTSSPC